MCVWDNNDGGENASETFYYRKDAQGNVIALLDSTGAVVVKYVYDAWGNHKVTNPDGSVLADQTHIGNLNPYRYRGYYYDTETGLYFLKTRYYDPEVGRFITIDDVQYLNPETINGLNLYAYCGNNPVMNVDPEGTWSWRKFWRTLAVVAIAVVAVVAIAAITVATGGSALPVFVGAGIGAATSFGISAITQLATTGTIDLGQLFVDMAVGGVMGAFGGSALGIIGMGVAGGVTGFAGSVATDFVAGEKINWVSAIVSGVVGAAFGLLSGGGAQHGKTATLKHQRAVRKSRIIQGKSTRNIDIQIKNSIRQLNKSAIKAQMPDLLFWASLILDFEANSLMGIFFHKR